MVLLLAVESITCVNRWKMKSVCSVQFQLIYMGELQRKPDCRTGQCVFQIRVGIIISVCFSPAHPLHFSVHWVHNYLFMCMCVEVVPGSIFYIYKL